VNAAFQTLSNKEKRERYDLGCGDDLFSTDGNRSSTSGGFTRGGDGFTYYYSGNIDPNDIFFNFFSGGGFEDAFGMNGDQFRRRYQRRNDGRNRQQAQPRNNFIAMIIQFFPI